VQIKIDFTYKGKAGERGAGAQIAMFVNGAKVAEGSCRRRFPSRSLSVRAWTSERTSDPRWTSRTSCPSNFTGEIDKVTIELQ
jgi:hypothetical protein